MNRIYKLKFDKRRNELVVVSEITAGMGKEKSTGHIADLPALSPFRKLLGTLTPVSLLTGLISGLLPAMVLAADLPTGGQIVGGQGSISTSGNQMTIHQQTQNMATNWHSFDIGKNNTVQFVQPDSSSVALNRVTGASGSQIMGTLKANGQVFILNPNGVLFGKNARVDVGGLVASTKNISTADFMKGQYTLSGEGNPGAQVINQGSLTTSKGGYIVLAGERVSNSGTVTTPGGKTVLAAGKTVTLQLDNGGLTSVSVNGSVVNALVENRGLISASNGQVYLTAKGQDMLLNTVVNNSGTVEAKGLVSRAGEIVLDGGDSGVVSQSGQLLADSQTGQGGKITLEGQNIHLAGGSLTSATGKTGGGEVYVGGGWQGKDSRIRNASKVVMDKTATVDVSATEAGNGGTAVLWSDDYTNFRGTVLAKGGSQSGNGGRVETSSHRNLQASGTVDASSPSGKGGEWLLDPTDVTIVGSGADSNIDATTNAGIFTPTASGARILNTSIVSQLNAGTNVTVKTSGTDTGGQTGNITLNADIVKTAGADTKLTLLADNNIATANNVSIGATTGKLNLDLLAGNITDNASVVLGRNINISLNGGDFYAGPGNTTNNISLQYSNNGKIAAGNITMNVTRGLTGYAASAIADNDLTINGTVSMTTGWGVNSQLAAGGVLSVNSPGAISLTAVDRANGGAKVTIKGDEGVNLNSGTGINLSAATTNNVSISSDKGDITLKASNGSVLISGADSSAKVNITSVLGGVTISGESASSYGVKIKNANISAVNGVIHISGIGSILAGQNDQSGSVTLGGNIVTNAREVNISGNNLGRSNSYFPVAGVYLGDSGLINWDMYGGDVNVYGEAKNGAGVIFGVQTSNNKNILNVHASSLSITGCTSATSIPSGIGVAGVYTSSYVGRSSGANFTLYNNADVYIFGDASRASNKVQGLSTNTVMDGDGSQGFAFSGNGNVYLHGISNDGDGVKLDVINNKFLTGNITIRGESNSGTGVYYGREPDIELVNAIVNGSSNSGTGLLMISGAAGSKFDLNGNVLTGGSETGNGVSISGSNVTITNGTLTGKAMTGSGSGVVLTGNSNYMFDNMSVTGTAVDGSGISVNGTLTVNNGSQFMGKAIGSGDGVTISGKLITSIGDGIIINGEASSGDGIKVSGDTTLTNVTLKGQTDAGNGVSIVGNLTADKASQVMGQATAQGTGVSVSGTVIGGKVDGTATSGGTGLQLANNAVVRETTLKGESESGDGVAVDGTVSLDDSTATTLNATSGSGAGLKLGDNANISIVNITTVTQEKKDSDGNTVTDATGNPVMETITMTTPVTTPVTLTGISQSGSGVATSGNVSISGVVLNGSATTSEGTGATLGGNLTIADNISGITVNAVGNGTALVVDSATIKADGYTSTGKDFVINASTSDSGGTAIKTQGNSQLGDVTLNGTAINGGTAVELGGQVSGGQITGTSDRGQAVVVSGEVSVDGTDVKGHSDAGTGLNVSGNATLTNATVSGETQTGTGAVVNGKLTADDTTQVTGKATQEGGTGVTLNGTVTGGKVDGTATSGDAVRVTDGGVLTNAVVTGNASTGTGLNVSGNATLTNATLSGETQTGSGAVVTGKLTITDGVSGVTAKATGNGTGLLMENATLQANGYVGPDKAHAIVATAEGAGGTAIKIQGDNHLGYVPITGNAFSVGGTGVSLGGQVSFANIKGVADRGTAVAVADGTVLDGGAVHGRSDNGTGLAADGNVTLNGALISGSVQGSGTGVSLKGNITGGTVTGISVSSGDAVQIVDSRLTDTEVKGDSQTGAGVKTQGNVTLQGTELSATSEHGITDLDVSGALNRDQYSVISADRIAGQENIHVFQPDTPPSPEEGGATGSGGNTTPDTGDSGGVAGGDTGSGESGGTVTPPSGGTGGDAGNNGNTGSTAGSEGSIPDNNAAQPGGAPGPAIREQILVSALRQQAVDAQVTRMNQATPDGFHSAATPVVPVTGYQAKPQNVEINLCDEESCQPEALDAAMPAEGVVTSSGK
ncbi:filamentous hemagglutinin N-terminal domain-containing protein [Salmonella enterica]|nr:filamentous hemagglutinin N-terminal domain-containing protein [Salmonella enterica]EBG6780334.1 filamentous hemagglutinin N-terminal domain-containing protein [Salmonella enterica]EBK0697110.1 filamentous hemagglutinin N-terminal domain-containing protein [Salmonella enterica]EDB3481476.1 filamentous hemagglutinin N-terminal domain-containing protein [Salmonella enterica]EFR8746027.1 filamentous hemagglutinin N-terminal domain-containing protein [Salmonella enterica]